MPYSRESALRESEEQLRAMVDSIDQLAWMADAEGWIFWYNRRWYEYTGTTPAEMEGWGWQSVHDPAVLPQVTDQWVASIRTGQPFDMVFPLRGADGVFRPFLTRINPVRDRDGAVVRWFGTNTDVGELRRVQEALEESEARFRQLAQAMPQLVWVVRPDGSGEYYNERWYAYLGIPREQQVTWDAVLHPDDIQQCMNHWSRSLNTGEPFSVECRLRRFDGLYRWFLVRGVTIRNSDNNEIFRWFGTCTDIQEQKQIEEALRLSNEDLQQFAYLASHDLQEPLRNVTAHSQLLARRYHGKLDPEAQEILAFIVEEAQRMNMLVEDLLTYSRATNDFERVTGEVNLNKAFEQSLRALSSAIRQTGANITADPLPVLHTDPQRLTQVFQNLIGNSLKYAKEDVPPKIHVGAERDGPDWLFSVRDNGIGFKQDYAQTVFGIFKRLHRSNYPGTGIGLAICKTVIERQGGRIWAEAKEGEGATFYFTLPAGSSPALTKDSGVAE